MTTDMVNHPPHYTAGKVECIDALEAASVGDNPVRAYCRLAAFKYLWRAGKKADAIEDAKKAIWYIERYIAHLKESP